MPSFMNVLISTTKFEAEFEICNLEVHDMRCTAIGARICEAVEIFKWLHRHGYPPNKKEEYMNFPALNKVCPMSNSRVVLILPLTQYLTRQNTKNNLGCQLPQLISQNVYLSTVAAGQPLLLSSCVTNDSLSGSSYAKATNQTDPHNLKTAIVVIRML